MHNEYFLSTHLIHLLKLAGKVFYLKLNVQLYLNIYIFTEPTKCLTTCFSFTVLLIFIYTHTHTHIIRNNFGFGVMPKDALVCDEWTNKMYTGCSDLYIKPTLYIQWKLYILWFKRFALKLCFLF